MSYVRYNNSNIEIVNDAGHIVYDNSAKISAKLTPEYFRGCKKPGYRAL